MEYAIRYLENKLGEEIFNLRMSCDKGHMTISDYVSQKEEITEYYNKLIDSIINNYYN